MYQEFYKIPIFNTLSVKYAHEGKKTNLVLNINKKFHAYRLNPHLGCITYTNWVCTQNDTICKENEVNWKCQYYYKIKKYQILNIYKNDHVRFYLYNIKMIKYQKLKIISN